MMIRNALLAAATILGLGPSAVADDIFVPADTPSIQFALNSASTGDRIFVSAGAYANALAFLGKDVEVIAVDGPEVTVLDGAAINGGASVIFALGTGDGALVKGFTIRDNDGDAVTIEDAVGTLENCVISGTNGNGIRVFANGELRATEVTITGCSLSGVDGAGGTSILERCEISSCGNTGLRGGTCIECLIEGNGNASSFGGGAFGATLIDCIVRDNLASTGGGGAFLGGAQGTTFSSNHATFAGGGYYFTGSFGASLSGATFIDNTDANGTSGAAISASSDGIFGTSAFIGDCVFVRNDASVSAYAATSTSSAGFGSCTFIDSDAFVSADSMGVANSIVRGGSIVSSSGTLSVTYSNVEGGAVGEGNIDADPLFVGGADQGVVCLGLGSPCIDTGNPTVFDPDGSVLDMGAEPYSVFCDADNALRGRAGFPTLTPSGDTTPGAALSLALEHGVPNGTSNWILGIAPVFASLKGGVLVPDLTFLLPGLPLDATGSLMLGSTWPAGIPAGTPVWIQAWMVDSQAVKNFSASNGVAILGS